MTKRSESFYDVLKLKNRYILACSESEEKGENIYDDRIWQHNYISVYRCFMG